MKNSVGLWIDHKNAVIVFVTGEEEQEIKLIKSDLKRDHGQSGTSGPADDIRQRELTEHLNNYYDEVIGVLRNTEATQKVGTILIMGPGEAKGELKKRLEINHLNGREVEIETTDKMTDNQLVAKVREYFKNRIR